VTFDEVLPALLLSCETWKDSASLRHIAVVRDLRGRLRLVVEPRADTSPDLDALRNLLNTSLGAWFTGEILSTQHGAQALRNVARRVLAVAPPWDAPRYLGPLGEVITAPPERWLLLERRVGKQPWLEGDADAPWVLDSNEPAVVTFYSFKGGVGRTTTLAACALLASQAGEDVVVIDLDLEAPGAGSLLGVAEAQRGALDVLVDHLATNAIDLGQAVDAPRSPAPLADRCRVIPAGRLDDGYLEKLARLDFSGSTVDLRTSQSPVRESLRALLTKVRDEFKPRWIFLDARAGLHDLAGLSLHGLAHVDVVFSRCNEQGIAGLNLVLRALSRRVNDIAAKVVLVHAMAPANVDAAAQEQARLRLETHRMFVRHGLYRDAIPDEAASDADHRPWTIRSEESIERNDRLDAIVPQLTGGDYRALWERITLLVSAQRTRGAL